MNDLISRKAAIDALSAGAMVNYQATGHNNGLIKAIDVIKELPSVQPETRRWIPCSERLPEPYAHVILTIRGTDMIKVEEGETLEEALKRNNQQYWVTIGYLADDGWNGGDGFPLIVKPIAWMEFPEPWKGEEK